MGRRHLLITNVAVEDPYGCVILGKTVEVGNFTPGNHRRSAVAEGCFKIKPTTAFSSPFPIFSTWSLALSLYGFYRGPSLGYLRARQRRQPSVMGLVALYERLSRLCFQPALGNLQSHLRKSCRAGEPSPAPRVVCSDRRLLAAVQQAALRVNSLPLSDMCTARHDVQPVCARGLFEMPRGCNCLSLLCRLDAPSVASSVIMFVKTGWFGARRSRTDPAAGLRHCHGHSCARPSRGVVVRGCSCGPRTGASELRNCSKQVMPRGKPRRCHPEAHLDGTFTGRRGRMSKRGCRVEAGFSPRRSRFGAGIAMEEPRKRPRIANNF